jgi:hypothetical protein
LVLDSWKISKSENPLVPDSYKNILNKRLRFWVFEIFQRTGGFPERMSEQPVSRSGRFMNFIENQDSGSKPILWSFENHWTRIDFTRPLVPTSSFFEKERELHHFVINILQHAITQQLVILPLMFDLWSAKILVSSKTYFVTKHCCNSSIL